MRRYAIGLVALALAGTALAAPAQAHHEFGFHQHPFFPRPFFFHHHRPFFFRHSFFHDRPFFGFGAVGVPVFYPPPAYSAYPMGVSPTSCQPFQWTVVINGQPQPAYGTACLEPDGLWHIMP